MDDDFLYRIRPPVRKAFADNLHQRLSHKELDDLLEKRKGAFQMNQSFTMGWTRKFAVLFTVVVMTLIFTYSGRVRARTLEWIREVAGFIVEERSVSPLKGLEGEEFVPTQGNVQSATVDTPAGEGAIESMPAEGEPPVEYPVPQLSLPEAIENLPFSFNLPTWVPEGYALVEPVAIANSKDWVMLTWKNATNNSEMTLLVEREYTGYNIPAGAGSGEEIQVNGQPALLIHGDWDSQHRWNPSLGIAVYWISDGHGFRLIYTEREAAHTEIKPVEADLPAVEQQLIRVAESMP